MNRPIDDKGHTALHWAAAMGDIDVVKSLIKDGASIDIQSRSGETPLMRAGLFVNAFDRQNMDKLAALLIRTVNMQDWKGRTVFHHIANTTEKKSKYPCARYYMDSVLNRMTSWLARLQTSASDRCRAEQAGTAVSRHVRPNHQPRASALVPRLTVRRCAC